MNSYLIAKSIFVHLVPPFPVSPFSVYSVFSTNEDPFNQITRKWPPESVFVDLLEKYLGINAAL